MKMLCPVGEGCTEIVHYFYTWEGETMCWRCYKAVTNPKDYYEPNTNLTGVHNKFIFSFPWKNRLTKERSQRMIRETNPRPYCEDCDEHGEIGDESCQCCEVDEYLENLNRNQTWFVRKRIFPAMKDKIEELETFISFVGDETETILSLNQKIAEQSEKIFATGTLIDQVKGELKMMKEAVICEDDDESRDHVSARDYTYLKAKKAIAAIEAWEK